MADDDRSLLPHRPTPKTDVSTPRILDLTSEDADLVFDALSSTTARRILGTLHDEPATPPEVAETLDLSLQNVHYHLRNLREAELITEAATGYSEKGVEMSVYAPAADPVVLSDGDPDERDSLRRLLERLVGVITLFGLISALAHWMLSPDGSVESHSPTPADPQPTAAQPPVPDAYGTPSTPTPTPTHTPPSTPITVPDPGPVDPSSFLPPGLVFFSGGVVMLLLLVMVAVWWDDRFVPR